MTISIHARVRNFVVALTRSRSLRDDEDLFRNGHLNSLAALELVLFVEREFGTPVPSEHLHLENFRSVAAMTTLVEALTRCCVTAESRSA